MLLDYIRLNNLITYFQKNKIITWKNAFDALKQKNTTLDILQILQNKPQLSSKSNINNIINYINTQLKSKLKLPSNTLLTDSSVSYNNNVTLTTQQQQLLKPINDIVLSSYNLSDGNSDLLNSFIDTNARLLEAIQAIPPDDINNILTNSIATPTLPNISSSLIAKSQPDPSSTLIPIKMGTRDYGSNNWTVYTGKSAPINNNWRSGYYLSTKNLGYGSQFGNVNTGDVVTMIIDIGTWNFKTANIFLLANAVQTTDISKYTTMNGTNGLFNNSPLILVGTDNIWDNLPKFDINNLPPSNISTLLINPILAPTVYKIIISPQDVEYKKRYITISHSKVIKSALVDIIFDL